MFCSVARAGDLLHGLNSQHQIISKSIDSVGDYKVHFVGDFTVVEVFIRSGKGVAAVKNINQTGSAESIYHGLVNEATIAIINGGFFGYKSSGVPVAIGLVRYDGSKTVKHLPWSYGGVFVSDKKGNTKIIPVSNAGQAGRWSDAIQSKPIIIYKGEVDVRANTHDAPFNRVAVGVSPEGDTLIVGVFQDFGQAATILQFARIYKFVADGRGLHILRALAMDGGSGAQIHLPHDSLRFGDTGVSFFPNAISFEKSKVHE